MLMIRSSLVLIATLLSSAVLAQEACVLPQQIEQPRLQRVDCENDRSPDSYVLAMSWSPEYCASAKANNPANRFQCVSNHFQFVVHGLWGQNDRAHGKCDQPRNCERSLVNESTIRKTLCSIPSVDLIQGEWQKHGTCTGMNEADYFAKTTQLWNALKKPDLAALLDQRQQTSSSKIIEAFVKANQDKGLSAPAIKVQTGSQHYLNEVHVCYDLHFNFRACTATGKNKDQLVRVQMP